jgi:PAS domain S-box-containing protein
MRIVTGYARLVAFVAAVAGADLLLAPHGWLPQHRRFEFAGLVLTAILIAVHQIRLATAEDRGVMPPSFVIELTTLLLFGVPGALFAAAAGTLARWVMEPARARPLRRTLLNAVVALAATEAAGLVHAALGGATAGFVQPVPAAAIAAAAVTYCLVRSAWAAVIVPLLNNERIDRSWQITLVRHTAAYCIGAAAAAALAEVITGRMWEVAAVAALPVYCAYRAYCDDVNRCEQERRRVEVIGSLCEGVSVVDRTGRVTLWDATLERLTGCPPQQALGRRLDAALPTLAQTQLPRTIEEVLKGREARMVTNLALPAAAGSRLFEVQVLPVAGGASLLWHDITARTQAEQTVRRN